MSAMDAGGNPGGEAGGGAGGDPSQENPLQGYYEWQVTTLMLAYDLVDPIPRGHDEQLQQRRDAVAEEVAQLVRALLPQEYLDDPTRDFPPELMMQITRATLRRAAEIAGVT